MTGHGEKLTRKMEQAIAALLTCQTLHEAALSIGIGDKTLWRWLQKDPFRRAYREARREVVRHVISKVQTAMGSALQTLVTVMGDNQAPASARVSAAKTIIDLGLKATEIEDLDARVERLEEKINNLTGNQGRRNGFRWS